MPADETAVAEGHRPRSASWLVYAAATGVAGAIPIPFVDAVLSELARGSAMRRVAGRHGLSLSPEARAVLSMGGTVAATSSGRARMLKAAISSAFAPFRIAARMEDAFGTLLAAVMFDRYLAKRTDDAASPLGEDEAIRWRRAMERAVTESGFDAVRTLPLGVLYVFRDAFRAAWNADQEGRNMLERFVDALLDGAADAPEDFFSNLEEHLVRELSSVETS